MYILLGLDETVYRDSIDCWCSWILLYPTACWIFPFLRGVCGSLPHNSGFIYFSSQLSFCLA